MDKIIISNSKEETQKLGEDLAKNLDNKFIALFGDLGSGKTTFTQGFAKGLGIRERIISPTFIIIREHKVMINDKGLRINKFYHVDLYRVQSSNDIQGLGLEEIFADPENIVVVEWAEKIKDILPRKRLGIYFENLEENQRRITFKNHE